MNNTSDADQSINKRSYVYKKVVKVENFKNFYKDFYYFAQHGKGM